MIRREWPTVDYGGPSDDTVRRVGSTSELEPLRRPSERLAKHYGWQPAQATIYILAEVVPVVGVRITTRQTFPAPGGVASRTVTADGDEDAEIVADAWRRSQREHGIRRRRKSADAERLAPLAPFVAEHGTGARAFERWNREHPADDRYASRSSFHRAAKKAKNAA